jgi:hypothetical protein
MNKMPKARPATIPSNRPEPSLPRTEPLAATSTIAGRATSAPATASTPGRSPRAMPAATGTTAAPTAETGPTTLSCPRASPPVERQRACPAGQSPGHCPDARPGTAGRDEGGPGQHGGGGRADDGDPERPVAPRGQTFAEVGMPYNCRFRAADTRAIRASGLAQIAPFRRPQPARRSHAAGNAGSVRSNRCAQSWQAALAATTATSGCLTAGGRSPPAGWLE